MRNLKGAVMEKCILRPTHSKDRRFIDSHNWIQKNYQEFNCSDCNMIWINTSAKEEDVTTK